MTDNPESTLRRRQGVDIGPLGGNAEGGAAQQEVADPEVADRGVVDQESINGHDPDEPAVADNATSQAQDSVHVTTDSGFTDSGNVSDDQQQFRQCSSRLSKLSRVGTLQPQKIRQPL